MDGCVWMGVLHGCMHGSAWMGAHGVGGYVGWGRLGLVGPRALFSLDDVSLMRSFYVPYIEAIFGNSLGY